METIALRLLLPPLVIAVASLAQGRLGDRLGGLVVRLPLTSGTFLCLLHLSHGPEALAHGALGMLVLVTAALHVLVALAALAWWPRAEAVAMDGPGRSARHDLVVRVSIGSALVIALTAAVETLGSGLAGTLAAAPLVALVLSPSTHRQRGARAVQDLLGGVVRGSLGAAAFGLVVAGTTPHLGGLALIAATAACLAVVGPVGRLDSLRQ